MTEDRRIELALLGLIAIGAVVPFWLTPAVPTNDGPAHLYTAWILGHWSDPALGTQRHFQFFPFVPNWGSSGPLVPLLQVFSPETAEKLFFSFLTALLVSSSALLARRLGGDGIVTAGLAAFLAHGWLLAMGFTGFLLALGAGLGCCHLGLVALQGSPGGGPSLAPSRARTWAAAAVLSACGLFLLHLAAAAFAGLVWLLLLLAYRRRLLDGRDRGRVALAAAPLLVLSLLCLVHTVGTHARVVPAYRQDGRTALDRARELPNGSYWEAYSISDRSYGQAAFALVVLLSIARLAGNAAPSSALRRPAPLRSANDEHDPSPSGWLAIGSALAFVAYLFAPWAGAGGAFITDRLLLLATLLVLPWASGPGLPVRKLFRVAAVALAVSGLTHRTSQYQAWGLALDPVLTANAGFEPGTLLVQPPLTPLAIAVDPRTHFWGRVATRQRLVSLDHYEAALVGWFPVGYSDRTLELSRAWTSSGQVPPGAVSVRLP